MEEIEPDQWWEIALCSCRDPICGLAIIVDSFVVSITLIVLAKLVNK